MTDRCETCFFFQSAGFAGNGWCLHKDRARAADVRTLVRHSDPACRDPYGNSRYVHRSTAAFEGAERDLVALPLSATAGPPRPTAPVQRAPIDTDIDQVIETRTVWAEKGLSA